MHTKLSIGCKNIIVTTNMSFCFFSLQKVGKNLDPEIKPKQATTLYNYCRKLVDKLRSATFIVISLFHYTLDKG